MRSGQGRHSGDQGRGAEKKLEASATDEPKRVANDTTGKWFPSLALDEEVRNLKEEGSFRRT